MVALGLVHLPLEVLSLSLSFLEPHSICIARQCCKALQKASKERIVWYFALKWAMEFFGVFEAAFPMASMTAEELELAACSNYKFYWRIVRESKESPGQFLHPESIRVLRLPRLCRDGGRARGQIISCKVQGERFLFVLTLHDLSVWDLGYIGDRQSVRRQIPEIASKSFEEEMKCVSLQAAHSRGASTLTTCIQSRSTGNHYYISFVILEFSLNPRPTFAPINVFETSLKKIDQWHTSVGLIVYYDRQRGRMVAWNYVDDTVATWEQEETVSLVFRVPNSVIVVDQTIQVVSESSLKFFPRPQGLDSAPQLDHIVLRTALPYSSLEFVRPDLDVILRQPQDITLRFFAKRRETDQKAIHSFSFLPLPVIAKLKEHPRLLPIEEKQSTSFVPDFLQDDELTDYWAMTLPRNRLHLSWTSLDGRQLNVLCTEEQVLTNGGSVILHEWPETFLGYYDYCPFSGRTSIEQSSNEIMVVDFVE